ncbi:MAG TPA: pyrrolidone-carboxylate peptidase [Planctomycetota bacterium]|nr:pyrrolidone-carboxylate peptidase [Planctomycetota bacterium]
MRTLVVGFEPWDGMRRNPSGEVARALGGVVLPVRYDRAERAFRAALRERRPAALLLLGLAPARRTLSLEAVALNVDHHEGRRWRRWRRPIRRGGPMILEARAPLDRLHRALRAARVPVSLSYHAGTFTCNHVFYRALDETRVPCVFLHLPPAGRVPLRAQLRAVRLVAAELERAAVTGPRRGGSAPTRDRRGRPRAGRNGGGYASRRG